MQPLTYNFEEPKDEGPTERKSHVFVLQYVAGNTVQFLPHHSPSKKPQPTNSNVPLAVLFSA